MEAEPDVTEESERNLYYEASIVTMMMIYLKM